MRMLRDVSKRLLSVQAMGDVAGSVRPTSLLTAAFLLRRQHPACKGADSLEQHGGGADPQAFAKLKSLLRYVNGDYADAATFQSVRKTLGSAQRPAHYLAIPQPRR